MSGTRSEKDSFGPIEVPADRLWGAQTERSRRFFRISSERMPLPVVHALALVKRSAARVNASLGLLDAKKAEAIAQGLSRLLADTYVLYLKTHGFHWNVEGPMFQTLHLMFMDQYTETWNAIDPIAERIRALGHYAPGSYAQHVKLATIKEAVGVPKAEKMVAELIAGQEAVARTARSVLPLAEAANDQPTLDLLTQRLNIHEKNAWMLRSLLKK